MPISDFNNILIWWFLLLVFGIGALPTAYLFLKKLWDNGYVFSKIIGVIVTTYLIFSLSVFRLLPFTLNSIYLVFALFSLSTWFYIYKTNWISFLKTVSNNFPKYLFEELIFFLVLLFWSFIRAHQPDIEGLEKFMDWGFINTSLKSTYLPPQDMWFAGLPINYYYFGQLYFALLTKVSSLDSAITYNLAIATCAALTFASGFSLSASLVSGLKTTTRKIIFSSLAAAILLTFGGNLHHLYKIIKLNITQNNGSFVFSQDAIVKAANSYWYPDATRFIGFDPDVKDKTIHEFPIYSFIVSDLHGHVNDIPVVILLVAIFYVFLSFKPGFIYGINFPLAISAGFLLSVCYMTNAWDFAVYGLLFAVTSTFVTRSIKNTALTGISIVAFKQIFNYPFAKNFIPMVEGVRLADSHSQLYQLFILYGGFWLITLPLLFFIFRSKKQNQTDYFLAGVILTAMFLIIIPEKIYLKDIYVFDHRRANTMFKLVYQAFILFCLSSGYALVRLEKIKTKLIRYGYRLIFFLVFFIHTTYLYFSIKGYYGNLSEYKGIYGLNFFKNRYPDNFKAATWLKSLPGQPTILEAVGDSYTDYGLISAATGLPTVQGWVVHEWLWRGGYDLPAARQADVSKIYQSNNYQEVSSLLKKYQVEYIFVGDKEYEKYKDINLSNFTSLGFPIVFQSAKTKIYKVI